jgi:ppGpp synthetase/RelA/SpoT-type nucleotidyltranferase
MMSTDVTSWYIKNRPIYKRLANKVEAVLREVFDMENISYHIVTSRAKEIESVQIKSNNDKYNDPVNQIQDFAGIRIITYVEDEVDQVCKVIEDNFKIDQNNSSNKSDELGIDKVGYKSVHYVATLKNDRLKLPEYRQYKGKYFEIQVRTILQHAWAEIEHDRNYKFSGKLPHDISRRFKILSGALEMADREFNSISQEIDSISQDVSTRTQSGDLDILLSSTTLTQFLNDRFSSLIESMDEGIVVSSSTTVIDELESYGITKLDQLNMIIPEDIEEFYRATYSERLYEMGMVRALMVLDDYDKYFTTANVQRFDSWQSPNEHNNTKFIAEYFNTHGVDWNDIKTKYNVSFEPEI